MIHIRATERPSKLRREIATALDVAGSLHLAAAILGCTVPDLLRAMVTIDQTLSPD